MNWKIIGVFWMLISSAVSAGEQKIIFNVESVSYMKNTYGCQNTCREKYTDPSLEDMQKEGWRIISSSPKEAIGEDFRTYHSKFGSSAYGCKCVGTQYVLEKADSVGKEDNFIEKENELLKREIAILKKENEELKKRVKAE